MRAYMIYSRFAGSEEGAALVFANSAKEAKKVGWQGIGCDLTDEYIDLGVRWLKGDNYLFEQANQKKLAAGIAHVINSPKSCAMCEMWGVSPLDEKGLCEDCQELEEVEG